MEVHGGYGRYLPKEQDRRSWVLRSVLHHSLSRIDPMRMKEWGEA